jgi:hypothetical protein
MRRSSPSSPYSRWWRDVSRAYGLPARIDLGASETVTDMPALGSGTSSSAYQSWIDTRASRLGIQADPSHQTIYLLFVPCTGSDSLDGYGCDSRHPRLVARPNEPELTAFDSMATITEDPASPPPGEQTEDASHELIEAATDTSVPSAAVPDPGWFLQPADPSAPYLDSSPFVEEEDSGFTEAADLAGLGTRWFEPFTYVGPASHASTTRTRPAGSRARPGRGSATGASSG